VTISNESMILSCARLSRGILWLLTVLGLFLSGCSRAPTDLDHFNKTAQLVERYMTTNVFEAKSAMLELLQYTRLCESANSQDINFPSSYAAEYSRLYLVDRALGRDLEANRDYESAVRYLQEISLKDRGKRLSPDEVRERVNGVNRYLGTPAWASQTNNSVTVPQQAG
jgi:hypothetical protein